MRQTLHVRVPFQHPEVKVLAQSVVEAVTAWALTNGSTQVVSTVHVEHSEPFIYVNAEVDRRLEGADHWLEHDLAVLAHEHGLPEIRYTLALEVRVRPLSPLRVADQEALKE